MFMLVGPNGAGKSTLYETAIRPYVLAPFINADLIQRDELRDLPMQAAYKAAEVAQQRRRDCLAAGISFVSESTFSHPSKLALIDEAKAAGFRVVIYHVHVLSPELSVQRVAGRKEEGGHDVPEQKVRERYRRNPELIRQAVLRADRAFVYDNSALNQAPTPALCFTEGKITRRADRLPSWVQALYAAELEGTKAVRPTGTER
jgi:predicted ABC-type ATPase